MAPPSALWRPGLRVSTASHSRVARRVPPAMAGSRSSAAACSAARARNSSGACAGRKSPSRRCRSSSRVLTIASRPQMGVAQRLFLGCHPRADAKEISLQVLPDTDVVAIDEVQFFDWRSPISATNWPIAACGSSSPGSIRTSAASRSAPCPLLMAQSDGRRQAAGHLRCLWRTCLTHATSGRRGRPSGRERPADQGRRRRVVRGPLPPVPRGAADRRPDDVG